ncbi:leukemia inhibitory factor receptor isoform X2 [Hyla sarda]|uniref:leukemia inhibitory factor receptor isoform X2 n=1 Tax=Hyla sarda TaxID=327740 RepID=UPI0024C23151|nr:leukemia inhibitory factor receptor isoform X2 [Hyla sarda]
MWNLLRVVSVLTAIQCLLPDVCSQASDFFKNLYCVTHDFENMSCRWDTPYPADQSIAYEVCSRSSIATQCFRTTGNQLKVEFPVFSASDINIEAKDIPGNPSIQFQKTSLDIPYVPYPPEINSLVADYQSDLLSVEWTVNSTSMLDGVKVTCEMNVLRGEDILAKNETLVEYWYAKAGMFHWNWTSDFPLNCSTHSVRVRCFVHEEYYDGEKRLSDWSATKTINGSRGESNLLPLIPLGNSSSGIRLHNLQQSDSSGDNIFCSTHEEPYVTGTVVFVGYPPDKPQGLSCEARHLKVINCTWKAGRDTGLYGVDRGTKYTLYERFSGVNTTCLGYNEDQDEFNCSYDIKKEQELHEFLLLARNPLGTSNTSLAINVTERIHPLPIDKFIVREKGPYQAYLAWFLPGKFSSINLICEVEIKPVHGETETRNVTLEGLTDSQYHCNIDNLHPWHVYDFRVRCSSYDRFWKWSDWSSTKRHRTLAAAPSKKLDIWREIVQKPEGREIKVYWKHLTVREANGEVTSYKVMWRPVYSSDPPQVLQLPADYNRTSIILSASDDSEYEIYVTAVNSEGSSPPSRITTVLLPSDVHVEKIEGQGDGINFTWSPVWNASCGYLVKWMPSYHPLDSSMMWKRFNSNAASGFISSKHFQAGKRYNVSLYGCKNDEHQILKNMIVYSEELAPLVAPNFTIEETTSSSILVKWDAISDEDLRGFLQGYLFYIFKQQNDSGAPHKISDRGEKNNQKRCPRAKDTCGELQEDMKSAVNHTTPKNITDLAVRMLKIEGLRSGTSYTLELRAYTKGGVGPRKRSSVLTSDNALGLILAIIIPIVVAVVLGIVVSAICYQKREWIKETFYPDIPNPENSKALQFPKNGPEGSKTIKTLEMNRCTPSSVEVVEPFPKILDTELNSPMSNGGPFPEDGSETLEDNHAGIIYTQPASSEDTSNSALEGSASPSVVYIDVQSMYQPQANSEDEPDVEFAEGAGYKPQMQLPINTVNVDHQVDENQVAASSGYRPQGHPNTWALDSPGSPTSMESENASFGSPCSVNSRHFLIPPVDDKDSLKPAHAGWSISSLFQNKQDA